MNIEKGMKEKKEARKDSYRKQEVTSLNFGMYCICFNKMCRVDVSRQDRSENLAMFILKLFSL